MKNNNNIVIITVALILAVVAGACYLLLSTDRGRKKVPEPVPVQTADASDAKEENISDENVKKEVSSQDLSPQELVEQTKKTLKDSGYNILDEDSKIITVERDNEKYIIEKDFPSNLITYDDYGRTAAEWAEIEAGIGDGGGDDYLFNEGNPSLSHLTNAFDLIKLDLTEDEILNINTALSYYAQVGLGITEDFNSSYVVGSSKYPSESSIEFKFKINDTFVTCLYSLDSHDVAFKHAE